MTIILENIVINELFEIDYLEIKKNNIYGILGENGSGKSTFLKILGGQVVPSKGYISIENKTMNFSKYNIFQLNNHLNHLRKIIKYISNETEYIENATVEQNIKYILNLNNVDYQKVKSKFIEYMTILKVKAQLNDVIKNVSFGNRKKIFLLCTFFFPYEYLLYDEPTLGLDNHSIDTFFELVLELDKTIMVATHESLSVKKYCNTILNFSELKTLKKVTLN